MVVLGLFIGPTREIQTCRVVFPLSLTLQGKNYRNLLVPCDLYDPSRDTIMHFCDQSFIGVIMKKDLGGINGLYPMPVTIIGAEDKGKTNFITVAHIGILNYAEPNFISAGMAKVHHTNSMIKNSGEFSVNLPSETQVIDTDYVGINSGKKVDKSGVFKTFKGRLKHAPMIESCPVTMECRLHDTIELPTHDVFIGEIVGTYADEEVLTNDGAIDVARVKPILFEMGTRQYWSLGNPIAKCWDVGKKRV
jgi:flavin reductase (DIM6/NTAB) family NADH-FMN oxidoreductase RutF